MNNSIDIYINDKDTVHILNKYIYEFINYLKKTTNLDSKTIYLYVKYIELFDRYIFYFYPELQLKDINEEIVNAYKYFCSNDLKNNNKTINKKLSVLTKFFNYLTKYKQLYPYNIMFNVASLKNEEEKKPTIFTTSELKIIFSQMDEYLYGSRDICISRIILETGMLTRDILNIKLSQLSIVDKTLTISNKNETKIYNLSDILIIYLNKYISNRNEYNKNNLPYLFLSTQGNKYSIRSYQLFFKEIISKCGLNSTYTPRHLRSTFLYSMSNLVSEERLKEISSQNHVKQYYELNKNPLRTLI